MVTARQHQLNKVYYLAGQNFFVFGSSAVYFAILWYIALKTSSGTWMMLATLSTSLPQILISLWAGVWADRSDRRKLIMLASGLVTGLTLIIAVIFLFGYRDLWLLLCISAVRSIGSGISTPAGNALLPDLADPDELTRLNGLNQMIAAILLLITPLVSGYILGSLGILFIFVVDLFTAIFGITAIGLIKIPKSQIETSDQIKEGQRKTWQEIMSGLKYIRQSSFLTAFMLLTCLAFVLVAPSSQLSTLYVKRTFGTGVWRLTLNELLWTIGATMGGLYLTTHKKIKRPVALIAGAISVSGVAFAVMGLPEPFWVYLAFMLISGICMPLIQGVSNILIQQNVAKATMGRVFSVLQIVSTGIYPVAMLFFGPLADHVPIAMILVVTGVLEIGVGLLFYQTMRRKLQI
ncbi:MFS transporter [Lactobacillus sp. CC-MHH1034]|uniref:MFS transporter n=1 Tax=Agrilactobacillus fermenti TaxID=2586909 RepID=UPI001E4644C2|nr:MFS transporter [Agrilactobacillus fermenti]MCD2255599.1 MFS transporter [Agrilactobacillus fermenti]